jgi:hypothetical protein
MLHLESINSCNFSDIRVPRFPTQQELLARMAKEGSSKDLETPLQEMPAFGVTSQKG